MVGPGPHHLSPLRQVLRVVVCGSGRVSFTVGELPFNGIPVPCLLIQNRARHAAEPVTRHLIRGVAKASQSGVYGVLAHRAASAAGTGKHIGAGLGKRRQLFQDGDCLWGERDDMNLARLHAACGNPPFSFV